jgi:dienelactone hydrolase
VAAFDAAATVGRVAGLALIGVPLDDARLSLLGEWPEVSILGVADPDDHPALKGAVDAFLASTHGGSDLVIGPVDDEALRAASTWLHGRVADVPTIDEVVLTSADGWEIHGTRWLPSSDRPVPGVVLLHTGRSDRSAFARLERLLVDAGLAVLNIDWRGRGASTNLGSYGDLPVAVRDAAWRDALAALDHLAGQPEVDARRLATVGAVHGAEYAARSAMRDDRVKAVALLTGYRPADPEESRHLTGGAVDVLYVTSLGHTITTSAMHSLHEATPAGRSQFVVYPGAAIGYQLFEVDPTLEPRVVSWLTEVLGA